MELLRCCIGLWIGMVYHKSRRVTSKLRVLFGTNINFLGVILRKVDITSRRNWADDDPTFGRKRTSDKRLYNPKWERFSTSYQKAIPMSYSDDLLLEFCWPRGIIPVYCLWNFLNITKPIWMLFVIVTKHIIMTE